MDVIESRFRADLAVAARAALVAHDEAKKLVSYLAFQHLAKAPKELSEESEPAVTKEEPRPSSDDPATRRRRRRPRRRRQD